MRGNAPGVSIPRTGEYYSAGGQEALDRAAEEAVSVPRTEAPLDYARPEQQGEPVWSQSRAQESTARTEYMVAAPPEGGTEGVSVPRTGRYPSDRNGFRPSNLLGIAPHSSGSRFGSDAALRLAGCQAV